ncbi:MAG TPA: N-acetylmuramoyl-L-alanine amidase [Alphaproteobacteria bacterium]|nr:N-acetylmuramoyl-L-alanine amidase [Alphaproteobacteria bacterium]HOO51699.1 N-acetylmuramoyl-L-alanine amidase [Alphaproteobacteria bacterium]
MKISFFAALVFFCLCSPSWALDITSIRFGTHPDKTRAVIDLSAPTDFRTFVLQEPDRLVVDMQDFAWNNPGISKDNKVSVRDVRYGSLGGGKGRLVFETQGSIIIQSAFLIPKGNGLPDRLVIDFKTASAALTQQVGAQVLGNMQSAPTNTQDQGYDIASARSVDIPLPPRKNLSVSQAALHAPQVIAPPAEKPLIIIDAGHGGQDPGARGANGMYEKTIVLAVAHELRRQLEDSGKYRVKMTRESDVFIPLRGRVNFARKHKGDLFISLHADSIRDSSVTGASVYTLSDKASDKETAKLAERENKSDLIAGVDLSHQEDDIADILIDLAARDTMNQSKFLANTVVSGFQNDGLKTLQTAHRSAGFAVLKAMDIPSILVEMGYLTNRSEVERLSSPKHRQKIATAIKKSIDSYFQKIAK